MKPIFYLLLFLLIGKGLCAQSTDMNYQEHSYYLDVYDNSGRKVGVGGHTNLSGSPMLNTDWGTGAVMLSSGKQVTGLPLQFDVQNNTLYFKKDSTVYSFAEVVSSFKMHYDDNGYTKEVFFRSGYPDHKGHPTHLLYQVINDGPAIHYIKYLQSNIDQHYVYGSAVKETYVVTEEPYIYDVKKNLLVKISPNKKSLLKALPDYKDAIEKFAADNHYNLDNDKEISELITSLNLVK